MKLNQVPFKMDEIEPFQPNQIVSLDHRSTHLYCEVIEVIKTRNLCWVRPLFLSIMEDNSSTINYLLTPKRLIDVRLTSDLFYPIKMFRPALDTEVIPWMGKLDEQDYSSEKIQQAKQQLHQFIFEFWQDYQEPSTSDESTS